jgi:hypothetical protein
MVHTRMLREDITEVALYLVHGVYGVNANKYRTGSHKVLPFGWEVTPELV